MKREDLYPRRFDAMVAALLSDYELAQIIRAKTTFKVQLHDDGREEYGDIRAGDGIYSGILTTTHIPGYYHFKLNIMASFDCGKIVRTETNSTLITIGEFNPTDSRVSVTHVVDNLYRISVCPIDYYGNLLGPGNDRFIDIFTTDGELEGDIIKNE